VEAGRVDDTKEIGADVDAFLDVITGCPGLGGDDDPILPGKGVEEAGFADIGLAEDDALDSVVDEGGITAGRDEVFHVAEEMGESLDGAGGVLWGKIFFGEVDVGFELSGEGEEAVDVAPDGLPDGAGKLAAGGFEGAVRAGLDELGDGLGLGKVETPVKKGPSGEFTGLGKAAAARKEIVENFSDEPGIAVGGHFEDRLAGKGGVFRKVNKEEGIEDSTLHIAVRSKADLPGWGRGPEEVFN